MEACAVARVRGGEEGARYAEVDPVAPPLLGGQLAQRGSRGVGCGDGKVPAVDPLLKGKLLAEDSRVQQAEEIARSIDSADCRRVQRGDGPEFGEGEDEGERGRDVRGKGDVAGVCDAEASKSKGKGCL